MGDSWYMRRTTIIALCVFAIACGGHSSSSPTGPSAQGSTLPPGPLSFRFSPIDPAIVLYIVPLGKMGPSAHTLPTDHIYFYHHPSNSGFAPVPVVAPASGVVEFIFAGGGDVKIGIRVNGTFLYYFDHVTLGPGIVTGAHIEAGSQIGTSNSFVFDFNVTNSSHRLVGFVNPARYGDYTLHTDAPLKYFEEPIRSMLYAKVQRVAADLDGRIDYDVAGTLSGTWFSEELPQYQPAPGDTYNGQRELAFAPNARFPDRPTISIGGMGMTGTYGVPPGSPDFTAVTMASGVVVYRLLAAGEPGGPPGTAQQGLLIVELLDAGRLRVEAVPSQTATTATFSADAQTYLR
jgi:hypothetical protein